jgi:sulfide:quinone oxidoreductase
MCKTVLILGAGTGGIVTAHQLSHLAGNDGEINPLNIVLFEREEKNVLGPLLLWLMAGKREPDQVYRATRRLEGDGVEVVLGEIEKMDPAELTVTVGGKEYRGDYMVVALGMEQKPYHRLNDFGYDFYSIEGAEALHEHLETFSGGKVAVVVPSLPVKGPTAPYQAAMLIEDLLRRRGLLEESEVSLYSPEPEPLPLAGGELASMVKRLLAEKGVQYYPGHELVSATAHTLTFENGITADYDLLVYTPRFQCPEVVRQCGLAGPSGWVEVNPHTLQTSFPDVYAIGDITDIPLEWGNTLPKTGAFAQKQAQTVACNLVQKIFGSKEAPKPYTGEGQLYIETGSGKASTAEGDFYAWPFPVIRVHKPDHFGVLAKIWSEKVWWLRHF